MGSSRQLTTRAFSGGAVVTAVVAIGIMGVTNDAYAFKPGTHVAAANETHGQLLQRITNDTADNTLVFQVAGRTLNLRINGMNGKEAYRAVREFPGFYRAGVIGPDAFPDPLTGQLMAHGNESPQLKDLVQSITGARPTDHQVHERFELRGGPTEFRSIDFATAMLEFLNGPYVETPVERQQILAFIMGYLSHGVGDGFAHTWVNQLAGGAWSFSAGEGIWGTFSEEIKHVAVETFVDSLVPDSLVSVPGDGGGRGQITITAPLSFLEAFYASRPANAGPVPANANPNGDYHQWLNHFQDFNRFHGGPFFNYFNAQVSVAPSLRRWSRLGPYFDLAEDIANNRYLNFGLDIADLPFELLEVIGNPASWIDELTLGFVDCHVSNSGQTTIDQLQAAIRWVGGINSRVQQHSHKAEVVRRNWLRMSECTSQNLAKTGAADFDPANPTVNTDACADIVRAGWVDEGNATGLYRGNVRPGTASDNAFLLELKAAFLGGAEEDLFENVPNPTAGNAPYDRSDAIEEINGHRTVGGNLTRLMDYLIDFGFQIDELTDVVIPEKNDPGIRQSYNRFCSAVRDPAFERCLDIAFAPIAAVGRQLKCFADFATCSANAIGTCVSSACQAACPLSNSQCAQFCGGSVSGCAATCDSLFCEEVLGVEICLPIVHDACTFFCSVFSSEADNCLDAAIVQAQCGVRDILCSIDNIISTITLENWAEELLTPARQACNKIDDVLSFIDCVREDPTVPAEQKAAERRTCIVDRCVELSALTSEALTQAQCDGIYQDLANAHGQATRIKDAASRAVDALKDRPAHELVNLAFLEEDLQNPAYLQQLQTTINQARNNLQPPPPGAPQDQVDAYNRRVNVLNRWDNLIQDVQSLPVTPGNLGDFANAAEQAALLLEDSVALGLIPTVVGPTAQKVLNEVGPAFRTTFTPFFNTVQGMKIAPLNTQADINQLFAAENVSQSLLPWNAPQFYSLACQTPATNPYCDVITSFDDPNCLDCGPALLTPNPQRNNWVDGRGLVVWNDFNASNPVRFVTTNFPVATSDAAYRQLYTRIFRVSAGIPGFGGFDDPTNPWTSNQAPITTNGTNFTEGSGSSQINGCGWVQVDSPRFRTADWEVVGDRIQFDLWLPQTQPNPQWFGDVQMFVTIPGANINNAHLGWQALTGRNRGAWNTIEFPVPENIRTALLGDFANAQFNIALNIPSCTADRVLLDNLRFAGVTVQRTTFHLRGSQLTPVTTNPLFSFDTLADWSSSRPLATSTEHVEGNASLSVNAAGYTTVVSRPFTTASITGVTPNLTVDVFIPSPQPNIFWYGDIQPFLTCGPLNNRPLGFAPLTNLFVQEFNTIPFTLPADVVNVLRGNFQDCRITLAVNVNPSGNFLLDNMGFH